MAEKKPQNHGPEARPGHGPERDNRKSQRFNQVNRNQKHDRGN